VSTSASPTASPTPEPTSRSSAHAADPHSLSDAELSFGVSPQKSNAVTYQDNVVLMEQGSKAIRSVSSDGMTWTLDGSAPNVGDIAPGKVLFATSRAVGKVLSVQHNGNDVSVVLGPVELGDVIKEADLTYDQPIDLGSMVAYQAPDYPGATSDMELLTEGIKTSDARTGDGTTITTAVLSRSGEITRVPVVPASYAPSRSTGDGTEAWSASDVDVFRAMLTPTPPPNIGPPQAVNIKDFTVVPFCCGGLGIKILHTGNDINIQAYGVLRVTRPSIHFDLKMHGGTITTAKVILSGAAGLTFHFDAATPAGLQGNVNKLFYIPLDLSIPITGMPVPFAVTLQQELILRTAFTAKNSTIASTADYTFTGQIFMGLDNGSWSVGAPTQFHVNSDPRESLTGLSLGVTGQVFAMQGKVIVGIGAFGFVTGPYLGYVTSLGIDKGSDQVTALVGVTCKGAIIDVSMNVGVGYSMPQPVVKAINAILSALNAAPITGSGGLKHNEKIIHMSSSVPKGCSGY
jgi:hypothetical protein